MHPSRAATRCENRINEVGSPMQVAAAARLLLAPALLSLPTFQHPRSQLWLDILLNDANATYQQHASCLPPDPLSTFSFS